MSNLRLLAHVTRCSIRSGLPKTRGCFSTSCRKFDEFNLWGKMATGQELQANVRDPKTDRSRLKEEKDETLQKIEQIKELIRESEQKLTGLQRMKYKQEEYDKEDLVMTQLRAMRSKVQYDNIEIEPVVTHTVQDIRSDRKFRFTQSFANLFTAASFAMICYGLYITLQKSVDEREAQQKAETAGQVSSKDIKDSNIKSEETSTDSIFD